jgi:hypothetical protein
MNSGPKFERDPHAQCMLGQPRPGHTAEQAKMMWPTASDAGPWGVTPARAQRSSPGMAWSMRLGAVPAGSPAAK